MPVRIRRVKVVQTANTIAAVYAEILGILFLIFGVFFVATFSSVGGFRSTGLNSAAGIIGLLIIWLIYVVIGWVGAAITCLVYNAAARLTGGIEFELTQAPPPNWAQPGASWGGPPSGG